MTMRPLRYSNAVVPHVYIHGAAKAVAFYAKAFGADKVFRIAAPNCTHVSLSCTPGSRYP